jgi:hypothetical protein
MRKFINTSATPVITIIKKKKHALKRVYIGLLEYKRKYGNLMINADFGLHETGDVGKMFFFYHEAD